MKPILPTIAVAILCLCSFGCEPSTDDSPTSTGSQSCYYNGHLLHVGPQGGCYYINSNGNQTYVDRSECAGCD